MSQLVDEPEPEPSRGSADTTKARLGDFAQKVRSGEAFDTLADLQDTFSAVKGRLDAALKGESGDITDSFAKSWGDQAMGEAAPYLLYLSSLPGISFDPKLRADAQASVITAAAEAMKVQPWVLKETHDAYLDLVERMDTIDARTGAQNALHFLDKDKTDVDRVKAATDRRLAEVDQDQVVTQHEARSQVETLKSQDDLLRQAEISNRNQAVLDATSETALANAVDSEQVRLAAERQAIDLENIRLTSTSVELGELARREAQLALQQQEERLAQNERLLEVARLQGDAEYFNRRADAVKARSEAEERSKSAAHTTRVASIRETARRIHERSAAQRQRTSAVMNKPVVRRSIIATLVLIPVSNLIADGPRGEGMPLFSQINAAWDTLYMPLRDGVINTWDNMPWNEDDAAPTQDPGQVPPPGPAPAPPPEQPQGLGPAVTFPTAAVTTYAFTFEPLAAQRSQSLAL